MSTESKTTRRNFIKHAAAAGAVAAAAPASAFAAPNIITNKKYEWNMAMTWPKVLPGLGTGAVRLGERITRLTEGRLTVKTFGAGEIVPALGVFDAVSDGSMQCAHSCSYYWLSKNRSFAFFTAVPGGMTQQEFNAWMYFDKGLELWHKLSAPFNIVPFAAGNTGTQMGGWFTRELKGLADLKGLKIRMSGLAGEVMTKLGANTQNIPGGELFTSLQSGVIDALEWVGPWNDMALGFHRIASHYYGPGFHEGCANIELIINKEAYEELPEDLQLIVKGACATETTLMTAEYYANNQSAFAELKKTEGLVIAPYPDEILKAAMEVSREVQAGTVDGGAISKEIYESYSSFQKKSMEMLPVTELAFLKARYL